MTFYKSILLSTILSCSFVSGAMALENRDVLYASCKKDLQLSNSGCDCLMKKMEDELNAKQQLFVAMSISGNVQGIMTAQGIMSGEDMLEVTTFMTKAPSACKGK